MSSEDIVAVRLTGVSKCYTVYSSPRYWLAEFLGFGRLLREGRHYRSFWALRDINLEVSRGSRVAIVGRNGAGKSTLLRIISENISPTTGTVETHGRCEALMQLGTGFNPEFSGRECVFSALGYMGVTGAEARDRLLDILEFSELEDFIDQPVRTYSAGMYLRLAFSVATVLAPEILIIDEVLSAGDLYFQAKCLSRIQALTSGPGTTVLFVSHDLEAAQRLCDTFVWVDRGRVVAQGPATEVRAAYEDSVRRQQEMRMRARNMRLRQPLVQYLQAAGTEGAHILGRIVVDLAGPGPGPEIHALRLFVRGERVEEIRVGDAMDDASSQYPSFVITDDRSGGWGPPHEVDGRLAREARPAVDGGAGFALLLHRDDFTDPACSVSLEVEYRDASSAASYLELNGGAAGMKRLLTLEHARDGRSKTARALIPRWIYAPARSENAPREGSPVRAEAQDAADLAAGGSRAPLSPEAGAPSRRFGTGQVRIDSIRFIGADSAETYVLRHGRKMILEISYHCEDDTLLGTSLVCAVGFIEAGGLEVSAIISSADGAIFTVTPRGRIRMTVDRLLFCNGTYRVSIGLFSQMDLHGYNPHFTASPWLFDLLARTHEIVVEGTYPAEDWVFRQPVHWESDQEPGSI